MEEILKMICKDKNIDNEFRDILLKLIERKNSFTCEICKCLTPNKCEGSEPNTCAMCMPLPDNEFMGQD